MTKGSTLFASSLALAIMLVGATPQPAFAEPGKITADDRIAACKRHPAKCTTYVDTEGTTVIFTGTGNSWECVKGEKYCTYHGRTP